MDYVVEDDTEELVKILEAVLPVLADEYLMTRPEFDQLLEHVRKECTVPLFREMYAQDSRELFVRIRFEPSCRAIIGQRKPVVPPVEAQVQEMLDDILALINPDETEEDIAHTDYVPNFILVAEKFEAAATVTAVGFSPLPWK